MKTGVEHQVERMPQATHVGPMNQAPVHGKISCHENPASTTTDKMAECDPLRTPRRVCSQNAVGFEAVVSLAGHLSLRDEERMTSLELPAFPEESPRRSGSAHLSANPPWLPGFRARLRP